MSEEKCNYCQGKHQCPFGRELEECDLCHKPVCDCDDCRMVITKCFNCPSLLQLQALKQVYEKYKDAWINTGVINRDCNPITTVHEFWQAIKAVCEDKK